MTPRRRIKAGLLWALAAGNVVLAGSLVARFAGENAARAQAVPAADRLAGAAANAYPQVLAQQGPVRQGEYIMIPGEAVGASVDIVYVIDTVNGILGGIAIDNNDRLAGMATIDLRQVFAAANPPPPGGGRR